jgi:hypothetical protein
MELLTGNPPEYMPEKPNSFLLGKIPVHFLK